VTEEERAEWAGRLYLPSDRRQRLFLCALCRRVIHLTTDERCVAAVEVAERVADGSATEVEVRAAVAGVRAATVDAMKRVEAVAAAAGREASAWVEHVDTSGVTSPELAAVSAAVVCQLPLWSRADPEQVRNLTLLTLVNAAEAMRFGELRRESDERLAQERVFRDVAHAEPITPSPSWLTSTVLSLAEGIYADRAFDRLPILADALQDAGCDHIDILAHCRSHGPHVRGCWVIDLLRGKDG
jgi:hypothetical protein